MARPRKPESELTPNARRVRRYREAKRVDSYFKENAERNAHHAMRYLQAALDRAAAAGVSIDARDLVASLSGADLVFVPPVPADQPIHVADAIRVAKMAAYLDGLTGTDSQTQVYEELQRAEKVADLREWREKLFSESRFNPQNISREK